MAVITGDLKIFLPDIGGSIDSSNEFTNSEGLFDPALDIDADVEKKLFIKNTNLTDTAERIKLYIVNGMLVSNTNNTPIVTANCLLYSHITPIGNYSLTFPDSDNVIVTPPGSSARDPQTILHKNGISVTPVYLQDNLPVMVAFHSSVAAGDTATININDGGGYLDLALDVAGSAGTYNTSPHSYLTGLSIGTLTAGQAKAIWVKQVIPDGITNALNNRKWRPIVRGAAA